MKLRELSTFALIRQEQEILIIRKPVTPTGTFNNLVNHCNKKYLPLDGSIAVVSWGKCHERVPHIIYVFPQNVITDNKIKISVIYNHWFLRHSSNLKAKWGRAKSDCWETNTWNHPIIDTVLKNSINLDILTSFSCCCCSSSCFLFFIFDAPWSRWCFLKFNISVYLPPPTCLQMA